MQFNYPLMRPVAPAGTEVAAVKTRNPLVINGEEVGFPAVNIQDYNWLKLRDFAAVLNGTSKQFAVGYDEATRTISLTAGAAYTNH